MALQLKPAFGETTTAISSRPLRKHGGASGWSAIRRQWPATVCAAFYLVLAMVVFGFRSLGPSHMAGAYATMDSIEQIWWLAWAAHAMPHVQDTFRGQGQNYPFGQNFGVNGSMLALGVIFAPITKLFGPVVTWNVLLRLALAASATSMCLVLRRWTTLWPAAFLGGLLYGFSAYTTYLYTYLFLIFAPLPPLIFLLLHEIFVRQRWRPLRTGLALALVCTLQFFISTEVLASTFVMGTLALALVLVVTRRDLAKRWRYARTAISSFLGVTCLLLAYPLLFTFAGPQHINGPPARTDDLSLLHGDLWSPLVPGSFRWLNPQWVPHGGSAGSYGELLYLGLPLFVALVCFAVFLRRRREILFAGMMALLAFVLALGTPLVVGGRVTSVPLPFALLTHLPALNGLQATRFALYVDLFAAAMFAIGIDELWKRLKQSRRLEGVSLGRRHALGVLTLGGLALAVCLPLVPRSTRPAVPTGVPAYFTSTALGSTPADSVVLAYPYPDLAGTNTVSIYGPVRSVMLDQAVAGMRFRLIGGYGWFPSPTGRGGTTAPGLLEPQSVQALFDVGYYGGTTGQRALLSKRDVVADLRSFLRKFHVQTVLVVSPPRGGPRTFMKPEIVISRVTEAIGPPVQEGGVTLWPGVTQRLAAPTSHTAAPPARPGR
jgi:hypothetical protein